MNASAEQAATQTAEGTAGRPYAHALDHDQRRARKPYTDRKLTRSSTDKVIGGVCGGIAAFTGISSRKVRIVYAISAVVSIGTTAVGYPLLWLLLPGEK